MSFWPVTFLPASAQTAGAAGTWVPVPTATMLAAMVDVSAGSGSPVFSAWLQGTNDPLDAEGFDVPADLALAHATGGGAAASTRANARDIVPAKSDTAAARYTAIYKHWPWKYARVRWSLSGGSLTFAATGGVK